MNEIIIKRPYRHFKGGLYYVHDIYTHTETGEIFVAYQTLYAPYGNFVRPLEDFMAPVPEGRTDNLMNQKYRFELFDSKK